MRLASATRLKRVPNEAVKYNVFTHGEEVRRFPHQYIKFVKSLDGHALWSNHDMRVAFQVHFHDCFALYPDLLVQEFHSYLADFPDLREVEVASYESLVTECEVCNVLKQDDLKKLSELDGLPYDVYLRMLHMLVPILTDLFNHWFAQGAIHGSIIKSVITILKKGGRHVWEDLDDYRPIILLNIELNILAQALANHLQIVISDWIQIPAETISV